MDSELLLDVTRRQAPAGVRSLLKRSLLCLLPLTLIAGTTTVDAVGDNWWKAWKPLSLHGVREPKSRLQGSVANATTSTVVAGTGMTTVGSSMTWNVTMTFNDPTTGLPQVNSSSMLPKSVRRKRTIIDNSGKPHRRKIPQPNKTEKNNRGSRGVFINNNNMADAVSNNNNNKNSTPSSAPESKIYCNSHDERDCHDFGDKFDYGPVPRVRSSNVATMDGAILDGPEESEAYQQPHYATGRPPPGGPPGGQNQFFQQHGNAERVGVLINPGPDQPVIGAPPIQTIHSQQPYPLMHFRDDITVLPRDIESPRFYMNPMFGNIQTPSAPPTTMKPHPLPGQPFPPSQRMFALVDNRQPTWRVPVQQPVPDTAITTPTYIGVTPSGKVTACFQLPVIDNPELARGLLEELSSRIVMQAQPAYQDAGNPIKQSNPNSNLYSVRIAPEPVHDTNSQYRKDFHVEISNPAPRNTNFTRKGGYFEEDDSDYAKSLGVEYQQAPKEPSMVIRIEAPGSGRYEKKPQNNKLLIDDAEQDIPSQPIQVKARPINPELSLAPIVSYRLKLDRKTAADVAAALEAHIAPEKVNYIHKHRVMKKAQARFEEEQSLATQLVYENAREATDQSLATLKNKITHFFSQKSACVETPPPSPPGFYQDIFTRTAFQDSLPIAPRSQEPHPRTKEIIGLDSVKNVVHYNQGQPITRKILPDDDLDVKPAPLVHSAPDSDAEELDEMAKEGLDMKAINPEMESDIDAELNMATHVNSSIFDSLLKEFETYTNSYTLDANDRIGFFPELTTKAFHSLPKLTEDHARQLKKIAAVFEEPVKQSIGAVKQAARLLHADPTSSTAKARFNEATFQLKLVKNKLNKAIMTYFKISFGDNLDEKAMAAMLVAFKKSMAKASPEATIKRQIPTTVRSVPLPLLQPPGQKTTPLPQKPTMRILQQSINKSLLEMLKKHGQQSATKRARRSIETKQQFLLALIKEKTKVEVLTKEAEDRFEEMKKQRNSVARQLFMDVKRSLRNSKVELLAKMEQLLAKNFRDSFTLVELEAIWEDITHKKPSKAKVVARLAKYAADKKRGQDHIGPAYTKADSHPNNKQPHPALDSDELSNTFPLAITDRRVTLRALHSLKRSLKDQKVAVKRFRKQSQQKMREYLHSETPAKRKEFLSARDELLRAKLLLHEKVRSEIRRLFGDPETISKQDTVAIWRFLLDSDIVSA